MACAVILLLLLSACSRLSKTTKITEGVQTKEQAAQAQVEVSKELQNLSKNIEDISSLVQDLG